MPGETPVTTPLDETVASEVFLLLQAPPAVASVNPIVAPGHTAELPLMAAIVAELTVTGSLVAVVPQAFVTVYFMVSTPAATAVTTPELLTVAMEVDVLLQVPPLMAAEIAAAEPAHIAEVPEITPA